jgi:capsular polysaccharide biosynthesis protein
LELRRYLSVLRRRLLLIIITVLVAVGAAAARAPDHHDYVASATILVGPQQFQGSVSNDMLTGIERVTTTFARLIASRPVASDAVNALGVPRSAAGVAAATRASVIPQTQLLIVSISDRDPAIARDLTNAVADAFVARVSELNPGKEGAIPFAPIYVFERAELPTAPVASGNLQSLIVAGLFGFVVAAGVAFLLEYLDITLKTSSDVERRLELPVLGVVPRERFDNELEERPALSLAHESA